MLKRVILTVALAAALVPVSAHAVTLNTQAAVLLKADGLTPLPANSTVVLLADADNDGFGDLTAATDSFKADAGDVILGIGASQFDSGLGLSFFQESFTFDNTGLEGVPLLLVWYDVLYNPAATGPGQSVWFNMYRNDSPLDGSIAWFVPSNNQATDNLGFLTTSVGGSNPDSAAAAVLQTVPEPTTGLLSLIGCGGLAVSLLRRRAA